MPPIYTPPSAPITPDDVERIAAQVARREVMHHEARFTVAGGAVAVVAIVLGLVATGRI